MVIFVPFLLYTTINISSRDSNFSVYSTKKIETTTCFALSADSYTIGIYSYSLLNINNLEWTFFLSHDGTDSVYIFTCIITLLSRGAWRYCLGHRVLSCMMCVVNFVFVLSQLQGLEWGGPGRREPDDEHSPASKGGRIASSSTFFYTQLPSLERWAVLPFWGFPALTCFLFF